MSKQNIAFMYGRVAKAPVIQKNPESGENEMGFCYVNTVRSKREIDDKVRFVKNDFPMVLTREKEILDQMEDWKENDIVFIKGTITTHMIRKTSLCPYCTDENGENNKNYYNGNMIYITPIYVQKVKEYGENKQDAIEDVVENREISNQIYVMGTVLRDPKIVTTKNKVQFTQYPLAINRKYTIRTDDPSIKTDYPIVKSYGEQAREDKTYLHFQSEVIIDGLLQARNVVRRQKCEHCGKLYNWKDQTMEIVPYAVEYVENYHTREEAEAIYGKSTEEYKQELYDKGFNDELEEELRSDDVDVEQA